EVLLLVVSRVGERPSSASNDELQRRLSFRRVLVLDRLISTVMVQVPSQYGADVPLLARLLANPRQRSVCGLGPVRSMQNDDDLGVVLLVHAGLDDVMEVAELARVDAIAECDVDTPDPPVVRQLDCKVASLLRAAPPAYCLALVAELMREGRKAVVPIVIASDEEQ